MDFIRFLPLCFVSNQQQKNERNFSRVKGLHCIASLTVSVYDLVDGKIARTITINKENYGGYRGIMCVAFTVQKKKKDFLIKKVFSTETGFFSRPFASR